ncbi:conserved hypothetical protein [Histoplasma capsulatum H143]|uniref:Uncharacterized protein n=1 Tax=Ajellomyces capsulatus (strain H143) TaxID=544712 RepID=C6HFK0_AJECH|nr:conserved hypothetical protein [Histoplasma capsulatum H143]
MAKAQTGDGNHHMLCPVTTNPPHKHQFPDQYPYNTSPPRSKRQKLNNIEPARRDNLSNVWFTKSALRELDRRNHCQRSSQNRRSLTRKFHAELRRKPREPFQFAPDFLRHCTPIYLKKIKRLARLGGPDLSDLRYYTNNSRSWSRKRLAEFQPAASISPPTKSTKSTKSMATTAYCRNFQQHLADHGIYSHNFEYPNGRRPAKPNNWKELNEVLAQPRPSLSNFSEEEFEKFILADARASKEKLVILSVIPLIEGNDGGLNFSGGGYPFGKLAPLTDGMLGHAKPDRFYGASPTQLNPKIRKELSSYVVPSTQGDLPILPNFFLEVKGPDGSPAVANRQACYYGALGARGTHFLQSYQQDKPVYDNNAYTITSTYLGGHLKLYSTHLVQSPDLDCPPEYIMTQLKGWSITSDLETFVRGVSAYRNARDWAKEKRDEFIRLANERHAELAAQSRNQSISQHQMASDPPITPDESNASTTPSEAGYQDANWGATTPVEDTKRGESQIHGRAPQNPRIGGDTAGNQVSGLPN